MEKGYKQTEIGVIPEDWEIEKIANLSELVNGRAYSQSELLNSGKYRVLRVGNFFSSDKWYWSNLELSSKNYVEKGDLMYAWSASFGPKFWTGEKTIFHYHIWKIIPTKRININYFFHLLENDKTEILKTSQGGTMIHITKSFMDQKKIPVPPLPEQEKIAAALSDADAWIESLEQLTEKKRLIKQGAMQQLLTPKEDWEERKLGEVVKIRKGQLITSDTRIPGDVPVVAGGKVPAYYHKYANRFGRTVTISASGANAGFVNFYSQPIFASDCSTIEEDSNYSIEFIYYLLQSLQQKIYGMQTGGAQPHIHPRDLEPILIDFPPLSEQTRIATILSDMDAEIESLEAQLAKARQIKQGMMQVLLTGKVRL